MLVGPNVHLKDKLKGDEATMNALCKTCRKVRVGYKKAHSCPECWQGKSKGEREGLLKNRKSNSLRGNDTARKGRAE